MALTLRILNIPGQEKVVLTCEHCRQQVRVVSRDGVEAPWLCDACRQAGIKKVN